MNVLFVAHEKNMGGASKSLITLVCELREKGNNVIVVTPFCNGKVVQELKANGIQVYSIFFGWWMMPEQWNLILKIMFRVLYFFEFVPIMRIAKIAKKNNIEIIHSNTSVIDIGARVARRLDLPHVWHFREFGDAFYKLMYLKGKKRSFEYVQSIKGKVIFISQSLRSYYGELLPDNVCEVIYNGISKTYLFDKYGENNQKEDVLKSDQITFLCAGNFQRNKRQDMIIEASRILHDKGYQNFKVVFAGASASTVESKKYEKELRQKVTNNISEIVEFIGFVEDMRSLRKKTDVELVCSSKEAFGRVTVEAMMASNPVIGSDSGATPELIRHGENGFLFKEGNIEELAGYMQQMIDNPQIVKDMGKRAYEYAGKTFPSNRNSDDVEKLYLRLV